MTYTDIYNAVVALTARPDLTAETQAAVQAATLRAHQSDFYARDMQESMLLFPAYQYSQRIDLVGALGRFRALKYVRKYDPSGIDPITGLATGAAGAMFEILDPTYTLDSYGIDKDEIATIAGNYLNMKSSTGTFAYAIVGWYTNPGIVPTNADYVSWIANEYPFAIVYEAASIIFKTTGRDAEFRAYSQMSAEQLSLVRLAGITGTGK